MRSGGRVGILSLLGYIKVKLVRMKYFNHASLMQPYCGIQEKHQISQVRMEIKVESRDNYKRSTLWQTAAEESYAVPKNRQTDPGNV